MSRNNFGFRPNDGIIIMSIGLKWTVVSRKNGFYRCRINAYFRR